MGNVYIQSHWRSNDGCGFWVGSQFWHGAEQLPAHPSSMYVALQGSPLLNMDAYSTQMFRHSCCTVLLEMQCLHKCCTPSEVGCQKRRLNPSSELPGGVAAQKGYWGVGDIFTRGRQARLALLTSLMLHLASWWT